MPGEPKIFHTKTGCVRISSEEVSCSTKAISLNLINDRKDFEKSLASSTKRGSPTITLILNV
jgi:hypothetical protein